MAEAGVVANTASALMCRVAVVLPAFNEEESLGATLDELLVCLGTVDGMPVQYEVVVVDDGSTDHTRDLARRRGLSVLSHPCNLGYGASVATGLRYAACRSAHAAVLMDADGQHDPGAIPRLLRPVLAGEADVAIGSRYLAGGGYRSSLSRRAGSALFAGLLSLVARRRVRDTTSGFQCIGREVILELADSYPTDYPDAQVILQLLLSGRRVAEVPASVRPRRAGRSMHSWLSAFRYPPRMVLSLLVVLLRFGLSRLSARKPTGDRGGVR